VNRIYLRARTQFASLSDASHACVIFGRLFISLIGILLPAMLWTERISTWDKFFQGGQDCEMSILALFAFFCLVILLAQNCRQSMTLLLAMLQFFSQVAQRPFRNRVSSTVCGVLSASLFDNLTVRLFVTYRAPLLI
jgi:hypothetical protein